MENKVNKILNSIKPTRREKLSKQREVRLSLIEDLKEHTETLEDLEYGESFETIDSVAKELENALQNVKNLASELEGWLIDFQEKPYDILVDNAEADIFEYKRLVEELGVPMDDEVKYLEDTIIGKYWYGNHERTFNEEPNYSYLVNQVNKLD